MGMILIIRMVVKKGGVYTPRLRVYTFPENSLAWPDKAQTRNVYTLSTSSGSQLISIVFCLVVPRSTSRNARISGDSAHTRSLRCL